MLSETDKFWIEETIRRVVKEELEKRQFTEVHYHFHYDDTSVLPTPYYIVPIIPAPNPSTTGNPPPQM